MVKTTLDEIMERDGWIKATFALPEDVPKETRDAFLATFLDKLRIKYQVTYIEDGNMRELYIKNRDVEIKPFYLDEPCRVGGGGCNMW